jgi:hypothetical protein
MVERNFKFGDVDFGVIDGFRSLFFDTAYRHGFPGCGVRRSLAAFCVRSVSQFRAPRQGSPTKPQVVLHPMGCKTGSRDIPAPLTVNRSGIWQAANDAICHHQAAMGASEVKAGMQCMAPLD